ncbi:MAG TPA: hypothetical protein VIG24_17785 [Acidimicrobiia bacterium]
MSEQGAPMDIELALDGQVYLLKPTLETMKRINRKFGSLRDALVRVQSLDFEAACSIVAIASGCKDDRQRAAVEDRLFRTGLVNVTAPIAHLLAVLMDPVTAAGDSDDEDESEGESEGDPGKL